MRKVPRWQRGLAALALTLTLGVGQTWATGASTSPSPSGSGGYSRPAAPAPAAPRAPTPAPTPAPAPAAGGSGGYARPGATAPASGGYQRPESRPVPAVAAPPSTSGADKALQRQNSGASLDAYEQRKARDAAAPAAAPAGPWGGSTAQAPPRQPQPAPSSWAGSPGWSPPSYVQTYPSQGSSTDPLLYWFMLDTLSRSGHSDYFHGHRYDPDYVRWRQQADVQARDNAELRSRLDELDRKMSEKPAAKVDAGYLPPDVNAAAVRPAAATAAATGQPSGGHALLWVLIAVLLLAGAGGAAYLILRRRSAASAKGTDPMFSTAKAVIDSKLGKKPEPTPPGPRLRLGQVLNVDPTPFILATGTKARQPAPGETTVSRIGRIERPVALTRLYVSDDAFYQIHVKADGTVDECRYFSKIDEVAPAGEEEWDFWLADADGMVGFPVFETKDGAQYARAWNPGEGRVPPVRSTETFEALAGGGSVRHEAMLYSRTLPEAAGVTEYLMVSVEKEDGGAYVGMYAGLDVSPAAIGL